MESTDEDVFKKARNLLPQLKSNDVDDDVFGRTIRLHLQRDEAGKTGEAGDAHSRAAAVTHGAMMDTEVDTLPQALAMSMAQERDESAKTGDAGGAAPASAAEVTHGAMMVLAISMAQAQAQPESTPPAASNVPATENREDADFFEFIEGTQKHRNGQNEATYVCKCCPRSRFGYESEEGTWSLDLRKQVQWSSPITCRTSDKDFKRTFRDHVHSKNGRHGFWDTVERLHKEVTTSGRASPSQQDLENLAAGGKILDVFDKYVGYVKDYEKNGDKKIIDCEKKGVEDKFEQAYRVLQTLKIVNSHFTFRFPVSPARPEGDRVVEVVNGAGGRGEEYPQLQAILDALQDRLQLRSGDLGLDQKSFNSVLKVLKVVKPEKGTSAKGLQLRGGGAIEGAGPTQSSSEETHVLLEAVRKDFFAWTSTEHVAEVCPLMVTVFAGDKRLAASASCCKYRLYEVDEDEFIEVVIINLSQRHKIEIRPVYVDQKWAEVDSPDGHLELEPCGGQKNLPTLKKDKKENGEEEEAWALKNEHGTTVLKLCFVLKP